MTNHSTPEILPLHERPYRPCVGLTIFNDNGQVFLGERSDIKGQWQMPQGGINIDEVAESNILAAGLRELEEETGITDVIPLAITRDWVSYDFPEKKSIPGASDKYRGQKQKWIAMRFTGDESSIRLDLHHEIEFSNWRWFDLHETPNLIVEFKKSAYLFVCDCFGPITENKALDPLKVDLL